MAELELNCFVVRLSREECRQIAKVLGSLKGEDQARLGVDDTTDLYGFFLRLSELDEHE